MAMPQEQFSDDGPIFRNFALLSKILSPLNSVNFSTSRGWVKWISGTQSFGFGVGIWWVETAFHQYQWFAGILFPVGCAQDTGKCIPSNNRSCQISSRSVDSLENGGRKTRL